jgi:formate hydrogenlyase transcriptional activator
MNCTVRATTGRTPADTIDFDVLLDLESANVTAADDQSASNPLEVLKLAIASSQSGIAVCNRFGRILFANRQLHVLLGYAPGAILCRDFRTIVPGASFAPDATADVRHGRLATVQAPCELDAIGQDGSAVPISITIDQLSSRAECLFVVSVIDRSESRRLEARLSFEEGLVKFQGLMSGLARRCADAKPEQLDAMLEDVLREIGEALDVDRCVAHLSAATPQEFSITSCWARHGCPRPPDDFDALKALPWTIARACDGESVRAATLDEVPHAVDRASMADLGVRAYAAVPLGLNGTRGALIVDARVERAWPPEVVDGLRLVAAVMSQAMARRHDRDRFSSDVHNLARERDQTEGANRVLRREIRSTRTDPTIASDSVAMRRVLGQVEQVAPTTATVLLLGETGTGKEVLAQAIHNLSPRQRRQMIRVSCAAIPTALIESELFGRERGAFTGALSRQIGRFEAANGSTIFLDEIGDLPLEIQIKLLRVLQERTVERLGGNQSTKVDVRVIAATNRNLEQAVANSTFREDLFYRLNVFPIQIPPLRERVDDIPSLVWSFIDEFSRSFGKKIDSISKESLAALQRYPWPGNVRELRNVIEREMIVATGPTLVVAAPRPASAQQRRTASSRLVDIEVEHIKSVLDSCQWRVRGAGGAAERLGVKPTTLDSRMARLGISRGQRNALA